MLAPVICLDLDTGTRCNLNQLKDCEFAALREDRPGMATDTLSILLDALR